MAELVVAVETGEALLWGKRSSSTEYFSADSSSSSENTAKAGILKKAIEKTAPKRKLRIRRLLVGEGDDKGAGLFLEISGKRGIGRSGQNRLLGLAS